MRDDQPPVFDGGDVGVESGSTQLAVLIPGWARQGFFISVPFGWQWSVAAVPELTWTSVLMRCWWLIESPAAHASAPLGMVVRKWHAFQEQM